MPPEVLAPLCDLLGLEEEVDRDRMAQRLLACGYHRAQVVEDPGTFSVRGGIIDLFPPLFRFPVRLELFGDWIDTIRLFDPGSQRTMRAVEEVVVYPVRETIPTDPTGVRPAILEAADRVNHPLPAPGPCSRSWRAGGSFSAWRPSPGVSPAPGAPDRYLPGQSPWVVVEPDAVRAVLREADESGPRRGTRRGWSRGGSPSRPIASLWGSTSWSTTWGGGRGWRCPWARPRRGPGRWCPCRRGTTRTWPRS